ncbi:unnamed protein product [Chrysoparadoxa australica]
MAKGGAPPARKQEGLLWPVVPKSKKYNDRSTTYSNKAALGAAIGAVDPATKAEVDAEWKWRQRYGKYLIQLVRLSLSSSDAAVATSKAGLDWCYSNFEFKRDDKVYKLKDAMSSIKDSFLTGTVKGTKPRPSSPPELKCPYSGKVLEGEALKAQVNKWVTAGTIEPSAGAAIVDVATKAEWRDLSDKYFVLLGAGSAMGPLLFLMELGANVVAVDLDRPGIWKRLLGIAKDSCGTMTFPLSVEQSSVDEADLVNFAGCNLLTQTPEIANWVEKIHPGKPLVVGAYAYLDGELHVRVSLAMDAIIERLTSQRKNVTPAYLCTPTDVHVIPPEAREAMEANKNALSLFNVFFIALSPLGWFFCKPNAKSSLIVPSGKDGAYTSYLVDGIVNRQGPNYALAKRMQHWRAIISREEKGCQVSSNIAPSTSTASVTSNKLFAMAYGGMHWFKPMEVFGQETSNFVMGALLLRDIADPTTPSNPKVKLRNPYELFSYGSFHGGIWRMGYTVDSIGEASILIYALTHLFKYLVLAAPIVAIAAAFAGFDFFGLLSLVNGGEL